MSKWKKKEVKVSGTWENENYSTAQLEGYNKINSNLSPDSALISEQKSNHFKHNSTAPIPFNNYYDIVHNNSKFVTYEQFFNQFKILLGNKPKIELFSQILEQLNEAFCRRYEIIFHDFVLSWTKDVKFSLNYLTLALIDNPSSNMPNFDFTQDLSDPAKDLLIKAFNTYLFSLLENHYIELFPHTVFFIDHNIKLYKAYFSEYMFSSQRTGNGVANSNNIEQVPVQEDIENQSETDEIKDESDNSVLVNKK